MTAPSQTFRFSGLKPVQLSLLRVEALVEAAELELYQAEQAATGDLVAQILEERIRLGRVGAFAQVRGSPVSEASFPSSARAQLIKLGALLSAVELPLGFALACIEPPGPDCRPAFAAYCRRLEGGLHRVRSRVEDETWGAP